MPLRPTLLDSLGAGRPASDGWPSRLRTSAARWSQGGRGDPPAPSPDQFDQLAASSTEPGCAVCQTRRATLERELNGLLAALGPEGEVRAVCTRHLRELAARTPADRRPVLARSLLDRTIERLDCLLRATEPGPASAPPSCSICTALQAATEAAVAALPGRLAELDEAPAQAMVRSICMPHLILVLQVADDPQLPLLVRERLAQLSELHAELDEFFRKSDYRFSHEPKGTEQTAWLRSFALFGGPPAPGADQHPNASIEGLSDGH
jgi:hypothetical protein